jgi:hypothetical protein
MDPNHKQIRKKLEIQGELRKRHMFVGIFNIIF